MTNRAPFFGRTVPKSGASDTSDVSAVAAVLPYMYVAIGSSDSGAKHRCSTVAAVLPYM